MCTMTCTGNTHRHHDCAMDNILIPITCICLYSLLPHFRTSMCVPWIQMFGIWWGRVRIGLSVFGSIPVWLWVILGLHCNNSKGTFCNRWSIPIVLNSTNRHLTVRSPVLESSSLCFSWVYSPCHPLSVVQNATYFPLTSLALSNCMRNTTRIMCVNGFGQSIIDNGVQNKWHM